MLRNRFYRLFPIYWVSLIICCWASLHRGDVFNQNPFDLLLRMAALQGWNPNIAQLPNWNGPAWSLTVLVTNYILFALLAPSLVRWLRGTGERDGHAAELAVSAVGANTSFLSIVVRCVGCCVALHVLQLAAGTYFHLYGHNSPWKFWPPVRLAEFWQGCVLACLSKSVTEWLVMCDAKQQLIATRAASWAQIVLIAVLQVINMLARRLRNPLYRFRVRTACALQLLLFSVLHAPAGPLSASCHGGRAAAARL